MIKFVDWLFMEFVWANRCTVQTITFAIYITVKKNRDIKLWSLNMWLCKFANWYFMKLQRFHVRKTTFKNGHKWHKCESILMDICIHFMCSAFQLINDTVETIIEYIHIRKKTKSINNISLKTDCPRYVL